MFTQLLLKNFKAWEDTGPIRLAPITLFFGANSSGKTSLLQSLLLLKQTAESADRTRVLLPGDDRSLVDLGVESDLVYRHEADRELFFRLRWQPQSPLDLGGTTRTGELQFELTVVLMDGRPFVKKLRYEFHESHVELAQKKRGEYELRCSSDLTIKRSQGRPGALPPPVRFYGFPDAVRSKYQEADWLADLGLNVEEQLANLHYVGPLREYPKRSYMWAGEEPTDVGKTGAQAVPALLAARERAVWKGSGRGRRSTPFEAVVAQQLQKMGIISEFRVEQIERRKQYEVWVKRSPDSSEVLVTDVGFGVSQVMPVVVQSYYAKDGSTVIFEQPEIHLHPRVQAALADLFIDACDRQKVQFLIESHSEHLLSRLQRRIAEGVIPKEDVALYVCETVEGHSKIEELQVDDGGNVRNWPKDFFGDDLADLVAMTEAALAKEGRK